ncbi:MAG: peptidylprolyl isomerase [Bacteroidales bacterium]|nr:peptidylprolyl isomerase [Bacteroidales bacterium]
MKRILLINVLLFYAFMLWGQESKPAGETKIVIETTIGNIELLLYNDTPLHRDNMVKLIGNGFYDGQIFHRVIKNFMIQGGDPHSIDAPQGQRLGTGGPGYMIDAEFHNHHYHKKGALAAARKGDNVNPEKKSSGSQFYIVHGQVFTKEQLAFMDSTGNHAPFTPEQIETYTNSGGAPQLDGSYTVFGEVTSGMTILDSIASVTTDPYDRPLEDISFSIRLK